jgi:uncharacterized membrane protein
VIWPKLYGVHLSIILLLYCEMLLIREDKSQGMIMKGVQLSQLSLLAFGLLFPFSSQASTHIDSLDLAIIFAPFLVPISLFLHLTYRVKIRRRSWPRKKWQVVLFCLGTILQIALLTVYGLLVMKTGLCPSSTYNQDCALMLFIVSTASLVFVMHCSAMHHVLRRYRGYCLKYP